MPTDYRPLIDLLPIDRQEEDCLPAASPHAFVMLPPGVNAREAPVATRRWLAKGDVQTAGAGKDPIAQLLDALGQPAPVDGLAALRKWGQTGERPQGWLCAADPVYLEARLDHLCLFALTDIRDAAFAEVIGHLQERLAADRDYRFSCIGACGYLESAEPMATAPVSPTIAHGEPPDRFLPQGAAAAQHDRLQSELQMCLHDLDLNRRREEQGLPPINALWFWGGGSAAVRATRCEPSLPALFTDDPVVTGHWMAAGGRHAAWPGGLGDCAAASARAGDSAFVAVPPAVGDTEGAPHVDRLRKLLMRGEIGRLTLLFRDGLRFDMTRRDRLLFWRRELRLPAAPGRL